MPINELERRIINFVEHRWFLEGSLPTPEVLRNEFKLTSKQLNLILEKLEPSFTARGIPTIEGRTLSPEQLTAINLVLNFSDTRSEKKKLADSGIDVAKWNGWRQNPAFKEYLLARTEAILGDAIPDVHMALVDRARNGDLGAIKMVYEMTGRYKADQAGLDPRRLLEQVFEIISLNISDPIALKSISDGFARLVGIAPSDTVNDEPPVAGEVIKNQIEGKF